MNQFIVSKLRETVCRKGHVYQYFQISVILTCLISLSWSFHQIVMQFKMHLIHCTLRIVAFQKQFHVVSFSVLPKAELLFVKASLKNKPRLAFYQLPGQFEQLLEDKSWKVIWFIRLFEYTIKQVWTLNVWIKKHGVTLWQQIYSLLEWKNCKNPWFKYDKTSRSSTLFFKNWGTFGFPRRKKSLS